MAVKPQQLLPAPPLLWRQPDDPKHEYRTICFGDPGTNSIGGNYSQSGGTVRIASTTARTVIVTGSFSMSGGTLDMSDGGALGQLAVAGNFSLTAGTITNSNSQPADALIVFNGSAVQTYTSGGTLANEVDFAVNSGATLQMGTGASPAVIPSGSNGTFTLLAGATLGVISNLGITTTGTNGNIQVSGTRTYTAGANYIYNGSVNQVTGNGLTQANAANLTIANTGVGGSNTVLLVPRRQSLAI